MAHIKTEELTDEEHQRLMKYYIPFQEKGQSYVRITPGNYILPKSYEIYKEQIYNVKIRPDDIFVVTWPKNGTTWTQEMVWNILNNANIEMAKKCHLNTRSPFLEIPVISYIANLENVISDSNPNNIFEMLDEMESPRIIKSHLPFHLLPEGLLENNKVILCLRNPKDTFVSYYHHEKLVTFHGYVGDIATSFDLFMDDLVIYSSYWKFTLQAWKERHRPNVCLLFYEDMKKDLGSSIRKVANFLNKELDDTQIERLTQHLSFKKMKENPAVNDEPLRKLAIFNRDGRFMRKGEVGDWKNYFTEEMDERMNKAIEENFKDTGLSFVYE